MMNADIELATPAELARAGQDFYADLNASIASLRRQRARLDNLIAAYTQRLVDASRVAATNPPSRRL